jgi:Undecaprenyl-phosphate galactose phosphotransferase WbaP
MSSSGLLLLLAALSVSWHDASQAITWPLFLALLLSVLLMPLSRGAVRLLLSHKEWWGYPTVIIGAGETGRMALRAIRQQPGLGLKPIAVVDPNSFVRELYGVPVYRGMNTISALVSRESSAYAIVAMPENLSGDFMRFIEQNVAPHFAHVLVIPSLFTWSHLWIRPKSLGNMLGLEMPQTSRPGHEFFKRLLDVAVSGGLMLFLAPLFLTLVLAIKLDSRGPALFGHRRIGRRGKFFQAWKFRTMVVNGDEILKRHLSENEEARAEWERDHKLRNDPRVTRVGKILRKTSLDELPQLWNVLKNEMSLVGPRPIVQAEVSRYGTAFSEYTRVKGGLTGLWQVSGRNDTTYDERVRLDTMYVRNSSVWLDLFILYRTVGVVLFGSGAY